MTHVSSVSNNDKWQLFLREHRLPQTYLTQAEHCFGGLLSEIHTRKQRLDSSILIGINGSQGSGKSTLAAYLQVALQLKYGYQVVSISIDDFYLSKQARLNLAEDVHPLFKTRGVPGTHNVQLAMDTLTTLKTQQQGSVPIPRFDKATDDCVPKTQWPEQQLPVDGVILEGWCVGALPQETALLEAPVNQLEREEDRDGSWRRFVNQRLSEDYQPLFGLLDLQVMLKAPSFDTVFRWRLEQEQKLIQRLDQEGSENRSGIMSEEQISRFIQHYQRITEAMLKTLPERVDFCYELDANRQIRSED